MGRSSRLLRRSAGIAAAAVLSLIFLRSFLPLPAWSEEQHAQDEHAGMSMSSAEPADPATVLSWKRESEFNHHLAGFFVVLAGLFILAEGLLRSRFPATRYVWPVCFLLSGLFLLVFSDTELWPFGDKPWFQGVITNPEVIQHKVFAVLLLGVGSIEMARALGRLQALWAAWIFPVLAVGGSILLLFHAHNSAMSGPDHMAIMRRIHTEHLSYSITGFGIGLAKGLAEVRSRWQTVFSKLWPALMMLLGVLLLFYVE
jgi:putative copper resistance protein D